MLDNYEFTGDYTTKFRAEVDALWKSVKGRNDIDVNELVVKCDELIEAYVEQTGERPKDNELGRLASLLVYDYTSSNNRWKSLEENAFQSNSQSARTRRIEIAFLAPEKLANSGRTFTPVTRKLKRNSPFGLAMRKV